MERGAPRLPEADETPLEADDDQTKNKKKRRKKRDVIVLASAVIGPARETVKDGSKKSESAKEVEADEASALLSPLANFLKRRREAEAARAADGEHPPTEATDGVRAEAAEKGDEYVAPEYEPRPEDLYAGEGMISLTGAVEGLVLLSHEPQERADEDGAEDDEEAAEEEGEGTSEDDELLVDASGTEGEDEVASASDREVPLTGPPENNLPPTGMPFEPGRPNSAWGSYPTTAYPTSANSQPGGYRGYGEGSGVDAPAPTELPVADRRASSTLKNAVAEGVRVGVETAVTAGLEYRRVKESIRNELKDAVEPLTPVGIIKESMEQARKRHAQQLQQSKEIAEHVQHIEQGLKIPEGHRLDTSSWLATEIGKDGRAVEVPSFMQGREAQREHAQEGTSAYSRKVATGGVAIGAAGASIGQGSGGGQAGPPQPMPMPMSPAQIPNASMQGMPSGAQPHGANATKRDDSTAQPSSAPLWPWIIALIVVVICLAVAVH